MADSFENFAVLCIKLTRYWNEIASEELKKYSIKASHGVYLMILHESKEDVTSSRLSKIAKRDKADVSRALSSFMENGLVKLKGTNNYRAVIQLTVKGKKLIERISKKSGAFLNDLSAGVSEKHKEALDFIIATMSSNIKELYE